MLSKLKKELFLGDPRFGVLFPIRRIVRAESLKSVFDNWCAVNMLWDNSLYERLEPVIRGRIIEKQSQVHCFDYYFGVCFTILFNTQ